MSFVERLSVSQRVPYRRFHHITCNYLSLTEWREVIERREDREPRKAQNLYLTLGTLLKITYSSFSHSLSPYNYLCLFRFICCNKIITSLLRFTFAIFTTCAITLHRHIQVVSLHYVLLAISLLHDYRIRGA